MTLHANLRAHAQEPHRGEITATASGEAPGPGQWRPVRRAGVSLVDQLAEHLALQIQNHGLRPGMRLPSVRAMAQEARLSRFTVVQAYDKLVAQGLIQSRKGSGFYVVLPPALMPAANEAESRREMRRAKFEGGEGGRAPGVGVHAGGRGDAMPAGGGARAAVAGRSGAGGRSGLVSAYLSARRARATRGG